MIQNIEKPALEEMPVTVALRVRPNLSRIESNKLPQSCVQINQETNHLYFGSEYPFSFDCIYPESVVQEEIYTTSVEPLLLTFFDGYDVTIIAYGQSSSGKTYTLVGPDRACAMNECDFGIIPRVVRAIFYKIKSNNLISSSVSVSYLEIDSEELRDFLSDGSTNEPPLIHEANGKTVIQNLTTIECTSINEVLACLESGLTMHKTDSSNIINEISKNSNSIFNVILTQNWVENGISIYRKSIIQFVDLSGSNRIHPEMQSNHVLHYSNLQPNINLGLLALGNVVSALGDPRRNVSHIPYNDSLLTKALKNCLGGSAVTLIICCITNCTYDYEESLNTLTFACRAKNILNKPQPSIFKQELIPQIALESYQDPHYQHFSKTQLVPNSFNVNKAANYDNYFIVQNPYPAHPFSPHNILPNNIHENIGYSQSNRNTNAAPVYNGYQNSPTMNINSVYNRENNYITTRHNDNFNQHYGYDIMSPLSVTHPLSIESPRGYMGITNRSTPNNVSPLSQRSPKAPVNLYWQTVNAKPQANVEGDGTVCEKLENSTGKNNIIQSENAFQDHFAATQYQVLVSNAEEMLKEFSQNNELSHQHKQKIDNWLCKKQEYEEIITSEPEKNENDRLAKIEEESETENEESVPESNSSETEESEVSGTVSESVNSDDFDSEASDTDEKLLLILRSFKNRTEDLISKTEMEYDYFVESEIVYGSGCDLLLEQFPNLDLFNESGDDKNFICDSGNELKKSNNAKEKKSSNLKNEIYKKLKKFERRKEKNSEGIPNIDKTMSQLKEFKNTLRIKENHVKELLKSGKETQLAKKNLEQKFKKLENKCCATRKDLNETLTMFSNLEIRSASEKESALNKNEYETKIANCKKQFQDLNKKLNNMEKFIISSSIQKEKFNKLEDSYNKLKIEKDTLERKIAEENLSKAYLEKELDLKQSKINDLQEKISLHNSLLQQSNKISQDLDKQKLKLQYEEQKLHDLQNDAEDLQKELSVRQNTISEKEKVLCEMIEKQKFNTKFNDEFQHSNKDELRVEIGELRTVVEDLTYQRQALDEKLGSQGYLSTEDERFMFELDEAIEAVHWSIEYKNELLCNRPMTFDKNTDHSGNVLMQRLVNLSVGETRSLLHKYFLRVLDLREEGRQMEVQIEESENKYEHQGKYIRDIIHSYKRTKIEMERKLTIQQREYEQKIARLLQKFTEDSSGSSNVEKKINKSLGKDEYYYKKIYRDIRQRNYQNESDLWRDGENYGHSVSRRESISPNSNSAASAIKPYQIAEFQRKLERKQLERQKPATKVTREGKKKIIIEQQTNDQMPFENKGFFSKYKRKR